MSCSFLWWCGRELNPRHKDFQRVCPSLNRLKRLPVATPYFLIGIRIVPIDLFCY
jgi:hypothetical protein